ncbi:MAG: bifunctional sugar-1-phosphate nucleotidylyltransferase/acetyltransferase [Candidatus Roizmanbacteria bacterium]
MQSCTGIILAAGKGSRLAPYSQTTPKPMVMIAGERAILHTVKAIHKHVEKIIIVVPEVYLELFRRHVGSSYESTPIEYSIQHEQGGTAHALRSAEPYVHTNRIFIAYADDIYDPKIFDELSTKKEAVAGKIREDWQKFGVLKIKPDNTLESIIEKPKDEIGKIVNLGIYLLDKASFAFYDKIQKSERGEYELTDLISAYAQTVGIEVVQTTGYWLPIGYPWHILEATEFLMKNTVGHIEGEIEPGVIIEGNVRLGKHSIIRTGTKLIGNFIFGEHCDIGPNCTFKNFAVFGDHCSIGHANIIDSVVAGRHTEIKSLCLISHTVFGNHDTFHSGSVTTIQNEDKSTIKMKIKKEVVDTGKVELGAFIGDYADVEMFTTIYPGIKMGAYTFTNAREVVFEDKEAPIL